MKSCEPELNARKRELTSRRVKHLVWLLLSVLILLGLVESAIGSDYTTYSANDYNIMNGTYLAGSIPESIQNVDSNYFVIRSSASATTTLTHNPSSYSLLGSTSWVFGTSGDLTADDAASMTFRSYFSALDKTDFVDNNASNVDSFADKGTHSNFSAQQFGTDLVYDTLTEKDTSVFSNSTLLNDGFEAVDWDANWDAIPHNWQEDNSPVYNGSSSAWATNGGEDYFTSDDLDARGASAIYVDFWFRKDDTDSPDFTLYYHDGSSYDQIDELDDNGSDDTWQHYTHKVTDSQYFVSNFNIRFDATLGNGENVWIDDVLIIKETGTSNYELDLEVQWTDVDYDETNEWLCIYGGTMGSENIRVEVWYGGSWRNVFSDLSGGWNNVSVSSYLTSSTLTIRFSGENEIGDTTQESWSLDAVLLHVWSNEETVKVEFIGSSNAEDWIRLNWTVNSAWTVGSIGVTLQLYNYSLGDYPTSGKGYMNYSSSATANTDETLTQIITTNPQHFRNASGNWKIKIKGVTNSSNQFDFEADLIEVKPTSDGQHVACTELFFSSLTNKTPAQLNFTIVSHYNISNVDVTLQIWDYSSSTYATSDEGYLTYSSFRSNETKSLTININPQFYVSNGNARLKIQGVSATQNRFQQEINQVSVSIQTPSQPTDWFTPLFYTLPLLFVVPLVLFLNLKRKKTNKPDKGEKSNAFSRSFGMTHQQIKGKKILLEIDPKSDYQNVLFNFVSEARNNDETLFILTSVNSALHSAFSGTENVRFLLTSLQTSHVQHIKELETLLPATDLSVMLDAIVRTQKAQTDKPASMIFDNLSDMILTSGFEKTYKFMRLLLEAISSPETTALFVFNPSAHDLTLSSSIRGLFQIHLANTKSGPKVETI